MNEIDDEIEIFDDPVKQTNKSSLPVFLIILLVLSSLNVVLGTLPLISSLFQDIEVQHQALDEVVASQEEVFSSIQEMPPSILEEMKEFFNAKKENIRFENNVTLLIYLLEGYGLFLMYRLRKKGFWVYLISQFSFFILFAAVYPGYNLLTTAVFSITAFTLLLFGIAYWTQSKYMIN